eukprot:gnl/MRDRNA2_/MRDRNA2_102536_c0_seq1.p1 gnl/MRDRNA2_/MRDRNA2_102536_c0~~gnl/MRDRNA2_/MRDRNA2_102536_c0_seq1.p1  ORF type:complete len:404 (-),score=103.82 gnl/MRDRNA2_/MRDRNA2_102536_c0_seq1:18-1229(-)
MVVGKSWLLSAPVLLAVTLASRSLVDSSVPSNEEIKSVCDAARNPDKGVTFLSRAKTWIESEAAAAAQMVGMKVKRHDATAGDTSGQKGRCAALIAQAIVGHSRACFKTSHADPDEYKLCAKQFCAGQCGQHTTAGNTGCTGFCTAKSLGLFERLGGVIRAKVPIRPKKPLTAMTQSEVKVAAREAASEMEDAMAELQAVQQREKNLSERMMAKAKRQMQHGDKAKAAAELAGAQALSSGVDQIDKHLSKIQNRMGLAQALKNLGNMPAGLGGIALLQEAVKRAPEDELAKEMTHDLEMNFNKIAPFGKEDTAKELQDHAAKTQDTLVDAVENAEVAEIKRAVFRALTRLRAATIKEFDTIARLETQAIDAYNDAHHYRAENPLTHLHEDEAPVETDKLKSFH